jgi:hypothetical protein
METPKLSGQKRSSLYFNKIDIYADRMEAKGIFVPRKVIQRKDILSWTEINKKHRTAPIAWTEFTIYTEKTKYMINSLHWHNFAEMKAELSAGKTRDTAKEEKIYKSIWS